MTIDATRGPASVHAPAGSADRRFTGAPGRAVPVLPRHVRYGVFAEHASSQALLGTLVSRPHLRERGAELTWRQIERFWKMEAGRRAEDVERLMGALIRRRR